ncbi:hypothetical protein MOZ60_01980 [Stecheria sp. CLA-KB-P133]|uniref:Uncharacterized protein n=1 Tax=Grylomicrobium aquisgranensis TaxID=2926318 RepID=A0AB35U6W3_9FIRM|nr:hypothetical protein [Lactimicrobium massiliense]MDD6560144.1 hypothetical protein [Lactimicrobium massiliense]MDX8418859.1 hypothetical protein [Stecheria sp. CLA-KB-P133]
MAAKELFTYVYEFTGPYEEKARKLTSIIDSASGAALFHSGIELFMTSAIVGALSNTRKPRIRGNTSYKIFSDQFKTHYDDCMFIFKLVMLTSKDPSAQPIDLINNAFKYSPESPEYSENARIFEEYMLGGLTVIYDKLMVSSNKRYDDYLVSLNDLINKYTSDSSDSKADGSDIDFDTPIF